VVVGVVAVAVLVHLIALFALMLASARIGARVRISGRSPFPRVVGILPGRASVLVVVVAVPVARTHVRVRRLGRRRHRRLRRPRWPGWTMRGRCRRRRLHRRMSRRRGRHVAARRGRGRRRWRWRGRRERRRGRLGLRLVAGLGIRRRRRSRRRGWVGSRSRRRRRGLRGRLRCRCRTRCRCRLGRHGRRGAWRRCRGRLGCPRRGRWRHGRPRIAGGLTAGRGRLRLTGFPRARHVDHMRLALPRKGLARDDIVDAARVREGATPEVGGERG
jgi:hypothetical protein